MSDDFSSFSFDNFTNDADTREDKFTFEEYGESQGTVNQDEAGLDEFGQAAFSSPHDSFDSFNQISENTQSVNNSEEETVNKDDLFDAFGQTSSFAEFDKEPDFGTFPEATSATHPFEDTNDNESDHSMEVFGSTAASVGSFGAEEQSSPFGSFEDTHNESSSDFALATSDNGDDFASFDTKEVTGFGSASVPSFGDFGGDNEATDDTFGGLGETEASGDAFGDFGSQSSTNDAVDAFGDFGSQSDTTGDAFGDFGGTNASKADAFGDFGNQSNTNDAADAFGDFGGTSASTVDAFGDFGNQSNTNDAADAFGDFGNFDNDFNSFDGFETQSGAQREDSNDWGASFDAPKAPASTSPLAKHVQTITSNSGDELARQIANLLGNVFNGSSLDNSPSVKDVSQDLSLDTLIQTPNSFWGPHRCEKCNAVYLPCSHSCLSCGKVFKFHEKKMLWNDEKISKRLFVKAMQLPEVETSHLNPLRPVTADSIQPDSKSPAFDPFSAENNIMSQVVASTTVSVQVSSPSSLNQTSAATTLTDFDLNLFGEVQSPKPTKKQSSSGLSDFDNFLLGFDSATPQGETSTNSMQAINEIIAKAGKPTAKNEPFDIDSVQQNNKKLMEIINKIPDLTFMSSKILVVPSSKYNFKDVSRAPRNEAS